MTLRVWTRCCLAPSELRRLFLFLQTLGSAHENQGCQRAARPSGATRPTVQRNQGPEERARGSWSHLFSTGPAAYFLKGQKPPCRRTSETEARLGAGFQQGDLLCWCQRLTWPGRQFRCHAERTWKNWCNPHENSMCWGSASGTHRPLHKGDDSAEPQHSPANRTPALAFSPRNMAVRFCTLLAISLALDCFPYYFNFCSK